AARRDRGSEAARSRQETRLAPRAQAHLRDGRMGIGAQPLTRPSEEQVPGALNKAWYQNVEEVTADSDFVATFRLRRPQPALIALLASGFSPVYPCHGCENTKMPCHLIASR